MARRRTIHIDGNTPVSVDSDTTISTALKQAGIESLPASVVSGGEIITASDFDRPAPPHDMLINLTDIEKGATLRARLLDRELELIARFLWEFPGMRRSLELDDNTLLIRAFPLPDDYTPDHIDLLIVIRGYPDVPPAGVHIPSKSPNRQQIAEHLGGHVMDNILSSYRKNIEGLVDSTWSWICYTYHTRSWRLNPNNLIAGDCLYKFIESLFAVLSGGHR